MDAQRQTIRILLVDDDPEYQLLVREILARAVHLRFALHWVASAQQALEALAGGEHDVCLLDYRLGSTNGLEVLRAARHRRIGTPIVLLTAQSDRDVEQAALRAGADDYLDKAEIDTRTLERAIGHAVERARTIEALKASEERFRRLFEHGPLGMGLIGFDLRFLKVNAALADMLGYSARELIGTSVAGLTHPDDIAIDDEMAGYLTGTTADLPHGIEKRAVRKDGETIWVDQRLTTIRNDEGAPQYALGVFENITRRKQLEEQLRQAQKMEAIGRLAGRIAHDFNNLLTVIMGYSDSLDGELGTSDKARQDLSEVKKAAERAAMLTRQLLAFSRRQILRPRTVDLNAIVSSTDRMLRRILGEDIRLITSLDPDLGTVRADPAQLEQVLLNLAVNARDAMPKGGTLTITTANVDLAAGTPGIPAGLTPGRYVLLMVSDTGAGIDEQAMAHLFEPFFTTKGARGTGLGLATAYGVVQQSGGEIAARSTRGRGATFDVYLPRLDEPAGLPGPPARAATRGNEALLVVEDDPAVRGLVTTVLRQQGYRVFDVSSAGEAIDFVERGNEPIHLLLTDIVMPELSGRELAALLHSRRPAIKVLYMSGFADHALLSGDARSTPTPFLQKPFTRAELARRVREILDE